MPFEAFEESLRLIRLLRKLVQKLRSRDPDLARQMRKAGSSASLNLAEGSGREGRDQRHHYNVSRGSTKEVRAALRTAEAWGDLTMEEIEPALKSSDRVLRLIWGLLH